eukprot:scaffold15468_cov111-Isochrysis_galbana.AAC.1
MGRSTHSQVRRGPGGRATARRAKGVDVAQGRVVRNQKHQIGTAVTAAAAAVAVAVPAAAVAARCARGADVPISPCAAVIPAAAAATTAPA